MPLLFRKLIKKRHWDLQAWLSSGDAPADALSDLQTTENKLSIFLVEETKASLDRVVAASALNRDYLDVLDLALVTKGVLSKLHIDVSRSSGRTPDAGVNGWHRDLVDLSASKLAKLAGAIRQDGEIKRYTLRDVRKAIEASFQAGFVNSSKLNDKMIAQLKKHQIFE